MALGRPRHAPPTPFALNAVPTDIHAKGGPVIGRGFQQPQPQNATSRRGHQHRVLHQAWTEHIPDEEWAIYERAIGAIRKTGRPFMLAGAFGLAAYTGRWRNTKDIDFY